MGNNYVEVLIFVHLEKTGGSTMRHILENEYGAQGFFIIIGQVSVNGI